MEVVAERPDESKEPDAPRPALRGDAATGTLSVHIRVIHRTHLHPSIRATMAPTACKRQGQTSHRTRLVSRNRITAPGASLPRRAIQTLVMEPGSLVMERKMLLGIKERAEMLA